MRSLGDFSELAKSIAEIGILQPIVVARDMTLIAGLHRLRACESLGWEEIPAVIVDIEGLRLELAQIDENLCRNDLTVLERGEHLSKRKRIYEFLHPETKKGGDRKSDEAKSNRNNFASFSDDTAAKTKLTPRTIQHEVQIAEKIDPEVKDAIRKTDIADSKTDLLELARLSPEKQKAVVARISSGEADTFKAALANENRQERTDKVATIAAGNTPIDGVKPCPIVYADPPWEYGNTSSAGAVADEYPTMPLADICALKVPATKDAVLFIWATSPLLPEAMEVIRSWDFTYKGSMVWDKGMGTGNWVLNCHELLLIATRGDMPPPQPANRPKSVVSEARGKHSAKPETFAQLIERMYPGVPKVEMFARKARPGWTVWGNQAA